MTNDLEWLDETVSVLDIIVDVEFPVHGRFYYGNGNDLTSFFAGRNLVDLYRPKITHLKHNEVLQSDVCLLSALDWDTGEMVKYYIDVVRKFEQHNKSPSWNDPFFAVRPTLRYSGGSIDFVCSESAPRTEDVLLSLGSIHDGEIFNDIDQGWELNIFSRDGRMYIRLLDPDYCEYDIKLNCSSLSVRKQASVMRKKLTKVLGRFRAELGHDYWI